MNIIVMNSIAMRNNRYESRLRASTVKMATPLKMPEGIREGQMGNRRCGKCQMGGECGVRRRECEVGSVGGECGEW